jgi:hypothetical protein
MTSQLRSRRTSGVRAVWGGVLLLTWLGAHGCGDDDDVPAKPSRDADVEADAADGSQDSGSDASIDASIDASDAARDGSTSEPDDSGIVLPDPTPLPCEEVSADDSFTTDVMLGNEGQVSLNTGTTGFGVAYASTYTGSYCGEIQVLPVTGAGAFSVPHNVLDDDCNTIRELALLHVAQGWRMVWIDNSGDTGRELQSMLLSENMSGSVGALRTQLTTNMLNERRPVLASVAGKPLLAFISTDPASGKSRITSQLLDGAATAQELVPETAGHLPLSLALSQIGPDDAALAWVAEEGKPGVWLLRTSLAGEAKGEPVLLTSLVSAASTVDLAVREEGPGGAVLYSTTLGGVNREVRFRRLSVTGEVLGDEAKIVGSPLQAIDASFARVGGGYAVAYRALPGGEITSPEIRLTFITKEGNIMRDARGALISSKLADAGAAGGRLTVRLSNDGQLLIGFVDATEAGKQLRLVRKRLDCAH